MVTGIHANIAARAADEKEQEGRKRITPYWRTLKSGGELNPKFPGGLANLKKRLIAEGHKVESRGKRMFVVDFENNVVTEFAPTIYGNHIDLNEFRGNCRFLSGKYPLACVSGKCENVRERKRRIDCWQTMKKLTQIEVIAFDADDTLWVNETFFRDAEAYFCELLDEYLPAEQAYQTLYETEMQNLSLYGYGIKPFTLSLIEAAIRISDGNLPLEVVEKLIAAGKQMLQKPVELLPGIQETLESLSNEYRLVMATKGDLLDQERKLMKSGLEPFFHHIEIVSDKSPTQYQKLVQHLDIQPDQFLMVGNSPRSDILPVLEIGSHAFHVPFHTTWAHEIPDDPIEHPKFRSFEDVRDILEFL